MKITNQMKIKGIWITSNGELDKSYIKPDNFTGVWKRYHIDGSIRCEQYYKNGCLHGLLRWWDVFENKFIEEFYKNGKVVK